MVAAEKVEAGVGERLQRSRAGEDGVLEGACAEGEGEGGAGIHLIGAGVGAGAADPDAALVMAKVPELVKVTSAARRCLPLS